jgi:hypothetical protein
MVHAGYTKVSWEKVTTISPPALEVVATALEAQGRALTLAEVKEDYYVVAKDEEINDGGKKKARWYVWSKFDEMIVPNVFCGVVHAEDFACHWGVHNCPTRLRHPGKYS